MHNRTMSLTLGELSIMALWVTVPGVGSILASERRGGNGNHQVVLLPCIRSTSCFVGTQAGLA